MAKSWIRDGLKLLSGALAGSLLAFAMLLTKKDFFGFWLSHSKGLADFFANLYSADMGQHGGTLITGLLWDLSLAVAIGAIPGMVLLPFSFAVLRRWLTKGLG
ncbi:hypothetical protein PVT67_07885 [Gallaecimonas kandeliae]|uniref:hypothetical protein n=1 Tax=Gallaecimonas kandeliae TaxID=3029055 RepID=UPI002648A66B|nr:hypothetical protein [Gallaecimonas kandeliae]WKE67145.1 hypothetical protein PVT67_07885 [Gallaecimonas kandeliae]